MAQSQMSSRERMFAAVTMKELPDQVPVVPLLMTRGIREGGVRVDDVLLDGEAQAHAKIKALKKFGGDVIIAGTDLFTPVFAISRVSGWLAHWMEQMQDNRIFRPGQIYVGTHGHEYVPIDER